MHTRALELHAGARRDLVVAAAGVIALSRLVEGPLVWLVAGLLLAATFLGALQILGEADPVGEASEGVPIEALITPAVAAVACLGALRLVPVGPLLVPAVLGAGWLIDRVDARAVVAGALALHALGWAIVASQTSLAALLLAAAPLGLGGGGFLPLPAVLQGRCFGRDAIGRVGGLHGLIGLPFLLASAPLVGWAEGRSGGFAAPFYGLTGVLLLAAGAFACLRIPAVEPGR